MLISNKTKSIKESNRMNNVSNKTLKNTFNSKNNMNGGSRIRPDVKVKRYDEIKQEIENAKQYGKKLKNDLKNAEEVKQNIKKSYEYSIEKENYANDLRQHKHERIPTEIIDKINTHISEYQELQIKNSTYIDNILPKLRDLYYNKNNSWW